MVFEYGNIWILSYMYTYMYMNTLVPSTIKDHSFLGPETSNIGSALGQGQVSPRPRLWLFVLLVGDRAIGSLLFSSLYMHIHTAADENWGPFLWVSIYQDPYHFRVYIRVPDFWKLPSTVSHKYAWAVRNVTVPLCSQPHRGSGQIS